MLGLCFSQASFIDFEIISGPIKNSLISRLFPSISLLNNSFIVKPIVFLSNPKVVATLPLGSKSINKTLLDKIFIFLFPVERQTARLTAVVVLAQPPL